jgi:hypothetical protein
LPISLGRRIIAGRVARFPVISGSFAEDAETTLVATTLAAAVSLKLRCEIILGAFRGAAWIDVGNGDSCLKQ